MSGATVNNQYSGSEIAVIGMAGRFPGAANLEQFWRNLRGGVEAVSFLTEEEMENNHLDPALLRHPNYVRARGVLEGAELFDASFFGYSPREAELIDPQQRVFLECAWEALENAGYISETTSYSIGVYAGASMSNYALHNLFSNPELVMSVGGFQASIANDKDFLTTRVSYKLNLEGPSVTIQTACSTSLVAVHMACQGLLSGECDMALSGGVSVYLPQNSGHLYQRGGILSPDGHCRAFDAQAQGTVGGNGVGIVVLKRLSDALRDRDFIYAVIKGSAINNDGSSKVGYTAPRVESQAKVIRSAQLVAGVEAETISYVEAHGTGTALGDPIEISALTKAFRSSTDKQQFCAIGSVKTNIGHLDAAAGVTGLIKTVLSLYHKQLPPSLHFNQPNPDIDFASSPFFVNSTLRDWESNSHPRRAGVSSFGIGGTNAHLVLEEAPQIAAVESSTLRREQLLILSAKSEAALDAATKNLAAHLRNNAEQSLADLAYTLQVGRRPFPFRRALVCQSREDAITALESGNSPHLFTSQSTSTSPRIAFLFSGQGNQYSGMGEGLYQTESVYRQIVDKCSELLLTITGRDIRELLYAEDRERANEELTETRWAQPALFITEYALAELLMSWGIKPSALLGHSIGEYVSAVISQVMKLEDAIRLVARRAELMQAARPGAMLAVALTEEDAQEYERAGVNIAAVNGISRSVLSGEIEVINGLEEELKERGILVKRLSTSHAFHSQMMAEAAAAFQSEFNGIKLSEPQVEMVGVNGKWLTSSEAVDSRYWSKQIRERVRYAGGVEQLIDKGIEVIIEVGPGRSLASGAQEVIRARGNKQGQAEVLIVSSMGGREEAGNKSKNREEERITEAIGKVWARGVEVEWEKYHEGEERGRVSGPGYAFQRERYWIEPGKGWSAGAVSEEKERGKKKEIADWFYLPSWKRTLLPIDSTPEGVEGQRRWLIFNDNCGVGARLTAALKESGQEVISVVAGEQFSRVDADLYAVEPGAGSDYESLIKELVAQQQAPDVVMHLWGITRDAQCQPAMTAESFEQTQQTGFYSLLYLAQALGQQNLQSPVRLAVVTNGLQDVTGEEQLSPEKATILGPCKVIPQEYANITCQSIDVTLSPAEEGGAELLVEQLIAEASGAAAESSVAYRGPHRWSQTFESVRLNDEVERPGKLREGGVYLITGGLGGIALALARYLAEAARAKLVLIGRTGLPERAEWASYLETHDETNRIGARIRKVQEIEALGGEVLAIAADVASESEMRAVVEEAERRFGSINGVIHTAGVPSGGVIQLKDARTVAQVMAPKVSGALVLDTVLGERRLDFMVFCASLASVIGGIGQVDYCAANAFLDAYAVRKAQRAGQWAVSINWGLWQEVGMAVETEVPAKYRELRELELKEKGIRPEEGAEAFRRILMQRRLGQVAINPVSFQMDRKPVVKRAGAGPEESAELVRGKKEVSSLYARPDLSNPYAPPTTAVEEQLCAIWQELLGIEQVGIHDNFFDLGGHSLLATQLGSRVRDAFKVDLPLRSLFEVPTVAGLSQAVLEAQAASQAPKGPQLKPIARQRRRLVRSNQGELLTVEA